MGINGKLNEMINISNIIMVDTRRKRQILTCLWRNIDNGIIETSNPVRCTRANIAPTIYLPIPRQTLLKKISVLLWSQFMETITSKCTFTTEFRRFQIRTI